MGNIPSQVLDLGSSPKHTTKRSKPKIRFRVGAKKTNMKKSILEFRQFHPGTEGEEVSDAQVKGDVEYEDSEEEEAEDEDEEETEESEED